MMRIAARRLGLLPWQGAAPFRALGAGLVGALVNTIAIRLVRLTDIPPGIGGLSRLTLAQGNTLLESLGSGLRLPEELEPVSQEVFHTVMGLLMGLVYALFFYRWLPGPGWLRGLIFCQVPWIMQAFVVLPWTGAGILGLHLSALTPAASFLLNALYGVTLGILYRPHPGVLLGDHALLSDAALPCPATGKEPSRSDRT